MLLGAWLCTGAKWTECYSRVQPAVCHNEGIKYGRYLDRYFFTIPVGVPKQNILLCSNHNINICKHLRGHQKESGGEMVCPRSNWDLTKQTEKQVRRESAGVRTQLGLCMPSWRRKSSFPILFWVSSITHFLQWVRTMESEIWDPCRLTTFFLFPPNPVPFTVV